MLAEAPNGAGWNSCPYQLGHWQELKERKHVHLQLSLTHTGACTCSTQCTGDVAAVHSQDHHFLKIINNCKTYTHL